MLEFISSERLDIYNTVLKVEKEQIYKAYQWNKALSGALMPVMQCLEITLRNAINNAIKTNPPSGAKNKWQTDCNWITSLPRYIGEKTIKKKCRFKIAKQSEINSGKVIADEDGYVLKGGKRIIIKHSWEETQVKTAIAKIINQKKPTTPDRIISMMGFGFWTNLMTKDFEHCSHIFLWPNLFKNVFPSAPEGENRASIELILNEIRELRNRLSHHEAIWKFHESYNGKIDYTKPIYGAQANCSLLLKNYNKIIELIGWINLERKHDFEKSNNSKRFKALCSIDGLNAFIAHEKIESEIRITNDEHNEVKTILESINKNQFIKISNNDEVLAIFGLDTVITMESQN